MIRASSMRLWRRAWMAILLIMMSGPAFAAPPKEDPALRKEIETSCRKFLDFFAGLQTNGGWGLYHHPTLWPFAAGERHCLKSLRDVDYVKGGMVCEKIMYLYLPAYEVFGDKKYLEVARRSCDVLVKGQFPNGVLQAHYHVRPDGRVEAARDGNLIEMPWDEGPGPALVMLIWMARVSGEEKYKRAAVRCAELFTKAQNPNGSWSQKKNLTTGQSLGQGYGVLNDGATTGPMVNLLLTYHVTKDPKFLKPVIKAADWLVRVQNKQGGIPGWAEQYGRDDLPCWGRSFEPPAINVGSTGAVVDMLSKLYRLTHDEKYLKPAHILIKWLREHPREKWGFYSDPKTGDPIYGLGYRICKGGNSPDMRGGAWIREAKYGQYDPKRLEARIPRPADLLKKRPKPDIQKMKAQWRRIFWSMAPGFRKAIREQNAQGYWVYHAGRKRRSMQAECSVSYKPAMKMLRALHYLAAAEGRVPPYAVGGYLQRHWVARAWPIPDQYDTPLRRRDR